MDLASRRPGPDVTRALAMAGVIVMNYHGYSILRGAPRGDNILDPWTGPFSTRFAATFVVTAGIGVTLMADRAGRSRRTDISWRIASRGVLLYSFGMAFDLFWPGTILPFYGAMFVLAAGMIWLRSRWIIAIGIAAALGAWLLRWWRYERDQDGFSTAWLTDPPTNIRGLIIDVFVNGTHPVLPWLAFFCAGLVLGRLMDRRHWIPITAAVGFVLFAIATTVEAVTPDTLPARLVLSVDPFDRGIFYTASALGTALLAVALITAIAERFETSAAIDSLRRAGQLSLTVYIAHAVVFEVVVDQLELVGIESVVEAIVVAVVGGGPTANTICRVLA